LKPQDSGRIYQVNPIDLARRLISFHTVSDITSTREIADFISNFLEPLGFEIEHHVYQRGGHEKVNVIARKGGPDTKLALSGHLDTVPFDTSKWNTDPLNLTEKDNGRLYGMGACDMKGFIAVAMLAGAQMQDHKLAHPFALVFTSDEEVGCIGARNLVREKGSIAEMIVIGEPTEFTPFILHKGYMFIRITLTGVRGHSSRPAEGKNVTERALPTVIERILAFKNSLETIHDYRLNPPYPTINIGKISTGDDSAKNVIAEKCVLELDLRPVPGQDPFEVLDAFQRHVAPGGIINGIDVDVRLARAPTPPFYTHPDSLIVKEAESMSGNAATSTSFNTEGGIFNLAGGSSVICGLGSIEQAHRPNEFVDGLYLQRAMVEKYVGLIDRICGKE